MRKPKPSGLRKYWPHLTLKQAKEERQKLADNQKDQCAICNKHQSNFKNRLAVDHNHKTGRVRGLLCFYCNKFRVGRQTIESCSAVLNYLLKFDLPITEVVNVKTDTKTDIKKARKKVKRLRISRTKRLHSKGAR